MKLLRIIFHIDNLIATLLAIVVIQHFTIYQNLDFLNPFINLAQDLDVTDVVFSKIRNDGRYGVDSNIVIVNIGILNRRGIAEEINIINQYSPEIIAIDAMFRKPKTKNLDISLHNAFLNTKNLVLSSKLNFDYNKNKFTSIINPCSTIITKNSNIGFVNVITDKSFKGLNKEQQKEMQKKYARTIRKVTTRETVNDKTHYSFPAEILKLYAPDKFERLKKRKSNIEIIDYSRLADKFITLDVKDIFERSPKLNLIRNRIVFMGFMGENMNTLQNEDIFFSPLNTKFIGKTFPDMYGVVLHANVLSMMLRESYFTQLSDPINEIIKYLIVFIMMTGLLFLRYRFDMLYEPISIILVFSSLVLWFVLNIYLFNAYYIYLDLTDLFFYILIIIPIFELYQDSLKPMILKILKRTFENFKLSNTRNRKK